jgi:AP-1 complex subunit gamma-1
MAFAAAEASTNWTSIMQAGNFVREEVLSNFIRLVAHTPELQAYTVHKLYTSLRADLSQDSLTLAAVWMMGEYGDVLLGPPPAGMVDDSGEGGQAPQVLTQVQASEVLDLLEKVSSSPYSNTTIRQYVIVSATKFSTRLDDASSVVDPGSLRTRITNMVAQYQTSVELEIQQRSVELGVLLTTLDTGIQHGVLERMPPPELRATVMGTGKYWCTKRQRWGDTMNAD